jgi:two-component system copper resistance phosphate regulon response regulator CusR
MRLLIIEDDPGMRRVLEWGFADERITTVSASTYAEGWDRLLGADYDVIILDVMLPGGNGLALCAKYRSLGRKTPVLLLTARTAVEDRVAGLEGGADDYLAKPFDFRELLARVRALARRPSAWAEETFTLSNLHVDLRRRHLERSGIAIDLTAKEWVLLEFFVRHTDRVVDRAAITSYVWDENHDPFSNVLEVLIGRLRRKLDDGFEPKLIHTLRGAGYRFGL